MTAAVINADTVIIVPARYASHRFPGKPLVPIVGADGEVKPLIQRSFEAASRAAGSDIPVYVATDDDRIADVVRAFGGQVLMTPSDCANGTERVAACLDQLGSTVELLINFQGDALLTPPQFVTALVKHMAGHPDATAATVAVPCSAGTYAHLVNDAAEGKVGGTTVVCDTLGRALYFSKRILPYVPPSFPPSASPPVKLHVGLYAYRRGALQQYMTSGMSDLEQLEGLEQLRFLANGTSMDVVMVPAPPWDMVEVNNPSDVAIVERLLDTHGIA